MHAFRWLALAVVLVGTSACKVNIEADVSLKELFSGNGAFRGLSTSAMDQADFRFLRFRPPRLQNEGTGEPSLPHIRLDRALQFLIGDRLQ